MLREDRININFQKMREEGADFQIIYDCKNGEIKRILDKDLLRYFIEFFDSPIIEDRGANSFLMCFFYYYDNLVRFVGQLGGDNDDVEDFPVFYAVYKVLSLMSKFSLKPDWYSPFLGRSVATEKCVWVESCDGVKTFDDLLSSFDVMCSPQDFEQRWNVAVSDVSEVSSPDIFTPLPVLLRQEINIDVTCDIDEDLQVAYAACQLHLAPNEDNWHPLRIVESLMDRFRLFMLRLSSLRLSSEDDDEYDNLIRKVLIVLEESQPNVADRFLPHHFRLINWCVMESYTLLKGGKKCKDIISRILSYLIKDDFVGEERYGFDNSVALRFPLPYNGSDKKNSIEAREYSFMSKSRFREYMLSMRHNRSRRMIIISNDLLTSLCERMDVEWWVKDSLSILVKHYCVFVVGQQDNSLFYLLRSEYPCVRLLENAVDAYHTINDENQLRYLVGLLKSTLPEIDVSFKNLKGSGDPVRIVSGDDDDLTIEDESSSSDGYNEKDWRNDCNDSFDIIINNCYENSKRKSFSLTEDFYQYGVSSGGWRTWICKITRTGLSGVDTFSGVSPEKICARRIAYNQLWGALLRET